MTREFNSDSIWENKNKRISDSEWDLKFDLQFTHKVRNLLALKTFTLYRETTGDQSRREWRKTNGNRELE